MLGVVILAQAILALCMERIINGHGDHIATWVHIVSMLLFLSYKIHPRTVMCSEYVYLCHRTFRLFVSRDVKNGHGDQKAIMVHMVPMVLFLIYEIHPRTVMCSEYVYLCHNANFD